MKILVAVPTFENISPDTFKSIYGLTRPDDAIVMFDYVKGYDCAHARNEIAQEAVDYGFDFVLMVDSDIILPSDTLVRMLTDPVPICLGCYPRKNTVNGTVELFKLGQDDFVETFTSDEVDMLTDRFKVKGGGFGCAFMSTGLFQYLGRPWFQYVEYQNGMVLSEDNYMCSMLAKLGVDIYADPNIRCGHIGRIRQWR